MKALVTGATGFVGGRLARRLQAGGVEVRCLVRDREGARARALRSEGFDVRVGDVLDPASLSGAGGGIDVAYYLVHSMGEGRHALRFRGQRARGCGGIREGGQAGGR